MDSKTFFDNFETIANAPGEIARLRGMILNLAVNGKLTPFKSGVQDLSDTYKVPGISMDIPSHWGILSFEKHFDMRGGGQPPKSTFIDTPKEDYIRLYQIRDYGPNPVPVFVPKELAPRTTRKGDILIARYGASGKVFWAEEGAYNVALAKLLFPEDLYLAKYAYLMFSSGVFQQAVRGTTRVAVDGFNKNDLKSVYFPLPPLEEQKRIVAKVDELMALCDELEAAQNQRDSIRTAARKSAIDSISTATTAEELDIAWKRIRDNWLTIADTPESIASLRSLILGMAVRGKLVDQRESEGVGSEFVSQFSGSYKPLTAPKKMPFEIPEAWVWSYLGNVSINRDYERVPISKPERETRQGPYDYYGASGVIDSYDEFLFDKPLLLIGEDGANLVNRSTPIAFMARGKYWVNNHAHVLDSTSEHALEYLAIVINQMDLKPFLTGTAQPKLNQAKLNGLQIPVPPFDEQKRIVAKVEELMALCGELERCMAERNKLAKEIAGAVTAEVAA